MLWFKRKTETEKRASYTEAAIQHILAVAAGDNVAANVNATAAAQAAAGLIGRSLAIATVEPETLSNTLNASVLYDIGRALVLEGEAVYLIEVVRGSVIVLQRASDWDVRDAGAVWRYKLTLPGATDTRQVDVSADQVFHPRINVSREEPVKGYSLIEAAGHTAKILANVERALGDEASAPSGHVLPAPLEAMKPDDLTELKSDLRSLKGKTAIVPSMSQSWGEGRSGAPADWKANRLGADPPSVLVDLRQAAHDAVLSAAGVPAALFSARSDATGAREALRQFLHSTLQPIGDLIAFEAQAKLDAPVVFNFDRLFASDLQGRARAFQSLVGGGMDLTQAAALSGLMQTE